MRPSEIRRFYDGLNPGRYPFFLNCRDKAEGKEIKIYPMPEDLISDDLFVNAPYPLSWVVDTSIRGLGSDLYRYVPAPIEYFSISHYLYIAKEFGSDLLKGFCEHSLYPVSFKNKQIRDLTQAGINSYADLVANHHLYVSAALDNPVKDILSRLPEEMQEPTLESWWTMWWKTPHR